MKYYLEEESLNKVSTRPKKANKCSSRQSLTTVAMTSYKEGLIIITFRVIMKTYSIFKISFFFKIYFIFCLFFQKSASLWCFQCSDFGIAGKDCPNSKNDIKTWKNNEEKYSQSDSSESACVLGYDEAKNVHFQV